jgi:4-amino-4-deoxy-L-arabinose transferase-like glycosyltransferase
MIGPWWCGFWQDRRVPMRYRPLFASRAVGLVGPDRARDARLGFVGREMPLRVFVGGLDKRAFRVRLGLITAGALIVKVVYVVVVTSRERLLLFGVGPGRARLGRTLDEYYYRGQAIALSHGKGFIAPLFGYRGADASHPPLTALVLAPVARFTDNDIALRLPVAVAGAAVVALIGIVAAEVAGRRAGLVCAVLAGIYPNLWVHDGLLMAETFSALTTVTVIYFAYRVIRRPSSGNAAAVGVACTVAAYARAELLLLLPLVVLPTAWFHFPAGRRLRLAGIAVCAAAVALAPWTLYNMSRFDAFVPISHGDGGVIAGANCDRVYSGDAIGYWDGTCSFIAHPGEPSVDAATLRSQGIAYMKTHLGRLPVVVAARVTRLWGVFQPLQMLRQWQLEGKPLWASYLGYAMYLPLAGLAVYGAILLRRRRLPLAPLVTPIILVTAVAAAFYGLLRNRVPAEVSIVLLAGIAITALLERLQLARQRTNQTAPAP